MLATRRTGADAARTAPLPQNLDAGTRHPDHLGTLATRHNIAYLTGRCGDVAEALRLFLELLPDMLRVLGPDHLDTLTTRRQISDLSSGE